MLPYISVLLVTSQLICSVIGGVPYGVPVHPAPSPQCYPKTVFVTVQQDVYNEVPVPSRVFKTKLVPTRIDLDQIETVYQDEIITRYHPEPVTTTVHEPILDFVTNYKFVTITKPIPVVATVDKNIPAIVTETDYSKVVSVVIDTDIVVKTDVVPVYHTTHDVILKKIRNTKVVPIFETVYDTKVVYKKVCPKGGKGYY